MLAIQARSLPAYFLMASSNTNQPPQFIGNKVTGILFENKADHASTSSPPSLSPSPPNVFSYPLPPQN
jgi:endoglucanase Acf2